MVFLTTPAPFSGAGVLFCPFHQNSPTLHLYEKGLSLTAGACWAHFRQAYPLILKSNSMEPTTDERIRRHKKLRQPMFILGITMTIIYVLLGAYLLLDKRYFQGMEPEFLNIFAVLLLIYGFYRGWRVYNDFNQ
jgi:hypothetical protein